jgi:hypothetical protein
MPLKTPTTPKPAERKVSLLSPMVKSKSSAVSKQDALATPATPLRATFATVQWFQALHGASDGSFTAWLARNGLDNFKQGAAEVLNSSVDSAMFSEQTTSMMTAETIPPGLTQMSDPDSRRQLCNVVFFKLLESLITKEQKP